MLRYISRLLVHHICGNHRKGGRRRGWAWGLTKISSMLNIRLLLKIVVEIDRVQLRRGPWVGLVSVILRLEDGSRCVVFKGWLLLIRRHKFGERCSLKPHIHVLREYARNINSYLILEYLEGFVFAGTIRMFLP